MSTLVAQMEEEGSNPVRKKGVIICTPFLGLASKIDNLRCDVEKDDRVLVLEQVVRIPRVFVMVLIHDDIAAVLMLSVEKIMDYCFCFLGLCFSTYSIIFLKFSALTQCQ